MNVRANIASLTGVFLVGLLGGCFDGSFLPEKDKAPWGRASEDFIGVWKAGGENYGKYYKSHVVDFPTIRSICLELRSDGTFYATNWPFEESLTGKIEIVSSFSGTWSYKYSKEDRFGNLALDASELQPFNCSGDALYWMPEMKGKSLRMTRSFAYAIYLEKVEPTNPESSLSSDCSQ